jgi:hypothetical protein
MTCCFVEGLEDFFSPVFRITDWFRARILDINNKEPCPASCRCSVFRVTNLPQLHAQRRLAAMTKEQMLVRGHTHRDMGISSPESGYPHLVMNLSLDSGLDGVRRGFGNVPRCFMS